MRFSSYPCIHMILNGSTGISRNELLYVMYIRFRYAQNVYYV
ncbi:hypothetical protein F383_14196 [Gossypium arboreum]|uniref:Uncharacterized protein n=1 Tax=Gossypium arboreum TaxID=29729 RepID=A0A0B0NI77_GOSAR|nr:hypothetical protein F383_14196 [Gossypium arboreum]